MARLIIFLRAINVGGHNVKMHDLRTMMNGYGFEAVETFIASGNVIVDRDRRKPRTVESRIEAGLAADLGYPVAAFARTSAELAEAVAAQPFSGAPGRYYVTFLKDEPAAEHADRLLALSSAAEELAVVGREVHWLVREGSESQLSATQAEWKPLGPGTTRNMTTVRKLAAKYPA